MRCAIEGCDRQPSERRIVEEEGERVQRPVCRPCARAVAIGRRSA